VRPHVVAPPLPTYVIPYDRTLHYPGPRVGPSQYPLRYCILLHLIWIVFTASCEMRTKWSGHDITQTHVLLCIKPSTAPGNKSFLIYSPRFREGFYFTVRPMFHPFIPRRFSVPIFLPSRTTVLPKREIVYRLRPLTSTPYYIKPSHNISNIIICSQLPLVIPSLPTSSKVSNAYVASVRAKKKHSEAAPHHRFKFGSPNVRPVLRFFYLPQLLHPILFPSRHLK